MNPAGQLNVRVELQAPSAGQDASGQPLTSWSTYATVWASVIDITGREYLAAGGTQNKAMTKIGIRHLVGVVPAMRVVCRGSTYNIEAVLGTDRIELTLICSRLAP